MTKLDLAGVYQGQPYKAGYQARVDPAGRWVTSSNVECCLTPIRREGSEVVLVGPTRVVSAADVSQSYSGWWVTPDDLAFVEDRGPNARILKTIRPDGSQPSADAPAAWVNDWQARDGHIGESIPGLYLDGHKLEDDLAGRLEVGFRPGPLRLCGQYAAHTINENRGIVVRDAQTGGIIGRKDFGQFVIDMIMGPGGWAVYRLERDPNLYAWQPELDEVKDVTIQPRTARFTWGEGLGWCWRRPNGEIWLTTWAVDQMLGDTYLLVRPLGSQDAHWQKFGGITYASCGDDGDHIVVIGSFLGDAWAAAIDTAKARTLFIPDPLPPPVPVTWAPTFTPDQVREAAIVTKPRWVGCYFDRNDSRYSARPGPGTVTFLVAPYQGDAARTKQEVEWGLRYGYAYNRGLGDTRPVIADIDIAPDVPDADLVGIYFGWEGGPAYEPEKNRPRLDQAIAVALARKKPLWIYADTAFVPDGPRAWFIEEITPLRTRPGLEIVIILCGYPDRLSGPDTAFDIPGMETPEAFEARLSSGFAFVNAQGFRRTALARKLYTQTHNHHPTYVESLQPASCRIAEAFAVEADLAFSWGRPGGVAEPPPGGFPSCYDVFSPWPIALAAAAARLPAPARLTLPAAEVPKPKPQAKTWWQRAAAAIRRIAWWK